MKKLLTCLALSLVAASSYAATPLWLRDVQISPDGTEIAFCYKGDIYKVPSNGGTATQLTTQASYECNPIWSPDSKQIAFASDRNGNFDLFVMSADGGAARRLTTHSASEIPSTFTTDGNFSAQIDGKPWQGTYTFDEKTHAIHLKGLLLSASGYATKTTNGISLLFDQKKLLNLIKMLSAFKGSSTLSAVGTIANSYDGMRVGFEMTK